MECKKIDADLLKNYNIELFPCQQFCCEIRKSVCCIKFSIAEQRHTEEAFFEVHNFAYSFCTISFRCQSFVRSHLPKLQLIYLLYIFFK
ncbi:MAG: hypothetical protein PHR96_01545 [Clostridia bacterium]|nr:hypothetical protein [Clostridia bacterium]